MTCRSLHQLRYHLRCRTSLLDLKQCLHSPISLYVVQSTGFNPMLSDMDWKLLNNHNSLAVHNALELSVRSQQLLLTQKLLELQLVDPNGQNGHALKIAVTSQHCLMVKLLLPYQEQSSVQSAFKLACFLGNPEIVSVMLPSVDFSMDDESFFASAVCHDHTKIVQLLLQDPRVREQTKRRFKNYDSQCKCM
ncbi:hypothetical protein EDD86DRAFT_215074 [Gorgonomyces haynaldii]|nr:hypothetical protein EDD86DRAFT_215074 [Gorgonomyces haynaldii]